MNKEKSHLKILFISQGRSGSTCFFNKLNKKLTEINPNHTYHTEISHYNNLDLINNENWKKYNAIEFLTDLTILKHKLRYNYFMNVLKYCIANNYIIIGLFRLNHLNTVISRIYATLKWKKNLPSIYINDKNIEYIEIPDKNINTFQQEINNKIEIIRLIKPHLHYFYWYEEIYEKDVTIELTLNNVIIKLNLINKKILEKQKERLKYITNLDKLPEYIKNYDYDKDFNWL